jgi:hypothetical protein
MYRHKGHDTVLESQFVNGYQHSFCPVCNTDLGMQPGRAEGLVFIPPTTDSVWIIRQEDDPDGKEFSKPATPSEIASLADAGISPARINGGWVYLVAV